MKARHPGRRSGARQRGITINGATRHSIAARLDQQPVERHDPIADDVVFEPEIPAIELLAGRAQGPGRLIDLLRRSRRPW